MMALWQKFQAVSAFFRVIRVIRVIRGKQLLPSMSSKGRAIYGEV